MYAWSVREAQRDECVVVDSGRRTTARDLRVNRVGPAEKYDRLIDEMGPEVVDNARRGAGGGVALPGAIGIAGRIRLPALVPGLERVELAELAGAEQRHDSAKVAVPAPIVERHHHHRGGRKRELSQLSHLVRGRRHRLVDHDRPGVPQHGLGNGDVGGVGRRHDHEIDAVDLVQQLVVARKDRDPGIAGDRLPPAFGVRGHHAGEIEAWLGGDERRVEHGSAEAVADKRHPPDGLCAHARTHETARHSRRAPGSASPRGAGCPPHAGAAALFASSIRWQPTPDQSARARHGKQTARAFTSAVARA